MSKKALTIRRKDALMTVRTFAGLGLTHVWPASLNKTPVALSDRATCEEDEDLLQLIPYMTLYHDGKIFVYERAKAGEEERLHANLSIGLGGHVDRLPADGETLIELLQAEAAREYAEEIGGVLKEPPEFTHFIIDTTNQVGRVHLGLHCLVKFDPHQPIKLENALTNPQWLPVDRLISEDIYPRLEGWSQAVADALFELKNEPPWQ